MKLIKSLIPTPLKVAIKKRIFKIHSMRNTVLKESNGILFNLYKGNFIEELVIQKGEIEPHIQLLFKKMIKQGWTALDIGANVGIHSLLMSQLVGEQGSVYAFEPVSYNLQRLNLNRYLNGSSNLNIIPFGVGEKNENSTFHEVDVNSFDLGNSSLVLNEYLSTLPPSSISKKTISMISLDDFCSKNLIVPNIIKIDIEGFEYFALKGAKNTLDKYTPILILEYNSERINFIGLDNTKFKEILAPHYDCYEILPKTDIEEYFSLEYFDFKRNISSYLLCVPKAPINQDKIESLTPPPQIEDKDIKFSYNQ